MGRKGSNQTKQKNIVYFDQYLLAYNMATDMQNGDEASLCVRTGNALRTVQVADHICDTYHFPMRWLNFNVSMSEALTSVFYTVYSFMDFI